MCLVFCIELICFVWYRSASGKRPPVVENKNERESLGNDDDVASKQRTCGLLGVSLILAPFHNYAKGKIAEKKKQARLVQCELTHQNHMYLGTCT